MKNHIMNPVFTVENDYEYAALTSYLDQITKCAYEVSSCPPDMPRTDEDLLYITAHADFTLTDLHQLYGHVSVAAADLEARDSE